MKDLEKISKHIATTESNRKNLAAKLGDLNAHMFVKMPKSDVSEYKICGVDGGFLKKEYHGMGLMLRRAVAVCFEYSKGVLINSEYLPSKNPVPEPIICDLDLTEQEFNLEANLRRVEIELKTAIQAANKFRPDILVLDGSILIYPASIPEKSSKVIETYNLVLDLYKQLYQICKSENILLAGSVEDSRGKRFCKILSESNPEFSKDLENLSDTLLLYYMLDQGYRTKSFRYSTSEDLPFLKDIGEISESCYAMYIKSAKFDRPLRVEFLAFGDPEENASSISSLLHEISGGNRYYCYPSVIIEADARAKLREQEIMLFKQMISDKIGHLPSLFELRRETRPF